MLPVASTPCLPPATPLAPALLEQGQFPALSSATPSVSSQTPRHCKGDAASVPPSHTGPRDQQAQHATLPPAAPGSFPFGKSLGFSAEALTFILVRCCGCVAAPLHAKRRSALPAAASHTWHFPGQSAPPAQHLQPVGASSGTPALHAPSRLQPTKPPGKPRLGKTRRKAAAGGGQRLLGWDPAHPPGDAAAAAPPSAPNTRGGRGKASYSLFTINS